MEVRFVKDWFNSATNKWISAGRMVHIMRKKALELIEEGYCVEILPFGFVEEKKNRLSLKRKSHYQKLKNAKNYFKLKIIDNGSK